jgi:hypothetical protein
MTVRHEDPMTEQPTTTVDSGEATITTKLRDLIGPGGNQEIVDELLEQDAAVVAKAALAFVLRLGTAARREGIDLDVLLTEAKPRSASDRLAEALRRRPTAGEAYQGPGGES